MVSTPIATAPRSSAAALRDPRYLGWSFIAGAASLVAYGIASAIIPNPVFGRQIPPEPFAIVVWIISAALMGLIVGTYLAPGPGGSVGVLARVGIGNTVASTGTSDGPAPSGTGSIVGYAGGLAAFLAIGCPVCNKAALVLLGASGALTIWAPLQPILGAASLVLLAATLAWRLRARARGGACPVR
jgi:hypothetical protein